MSRLVADGVNKIDEELSAEIDEITNQTASLIGNGERTSTDITFYEKQTSKCVIKAFICQYEHEKHYAFSLPSFGNESAVSWPMDEDSYDGTVHLVTDKNSYRIYDDEGDIEKLDLNQHVSE